VGLVSSMPQRNKQPNGSKKENEEKEDPSTIMRCLAENWKKDDGTEGINEKAINDCRDCFKGIKGSLSKAKECVAQHLPAENGNCTSQIDAFQSWDDKEKGMEVLDCFDKTLERMNNEECLAGTPNTEDVDEKLTDATMCIMESWKYGMTYVKKEMKVQGGKSKGRRPRKGKKHGKKGGKKAMMMKLLTKAHCDLESEGDAAKTSECFKCFASAVKAGMKKGGRGKKEMSTEMVAELTKCGNKYLENKYSECNAMMEDSTVDKEEKHKCYMRVLIKNEVGKCRSGIEEVKDITSDKLTDVLQCGKENAIEWAKKNASPKEAKAIVDFLDDDDDDDENDDDEMKG